MRATLPAPDAREFKAKNHSPDKETIRRYVYVVHDPQRGELAFPVDVRWYMGRSGGASVYYCSVWIWPRNAKEKHLSGHGKAGGYGYCKYSASFAEALASAGVDMNGASIHGVGDTAVRNAMQAVAHACGYGRLKAWQIIT